MREPSTAERVGVGAEPARAAQRPRPRPSGVAQAAPTAARPPTRRGLRTDSRGEADRRGCGRVGKRDRTAGGRRGQGGDGEGLGGRVRKKESSGGLGLGRNEWAGVAVMEEGEAAADSLVC